MKNSTDNQDMLAYAEEATAKVAETLVESSKVSGAKKSRRFNEEANKVHEFDPAAQTIIKIFDALESNNPVNNLEKLDQKNEGIKEHSSISTKIKNFVKSLIKFLKSPFTKQSKAELDKATEETVEEIIASSKERQNSQDQMVDSHNIPSAMPEKKPMQAKQAETQRPRTAPPPPPERKPTSHEQTVNSRTPPPPPSMNNTFKPIVDQKGGLDAIKQGVKLNNAADRKLNDGKESQDKQPDYLGELEAHLKARREKSGEARSTKLFSNKFAKDAELFETARKEEQERQAKAEKLENEKVAKATADEIAQKAETQSKPAALNLKPGEVPPPPPPEFQSNKPNIKVDPAPAQKNQQQNRGPQQFNVDKGVIQDIRATLKKANKESKKVEEQPQTDFRNVLNKKDRSPER